MNYKYCTKCGKPLTDTDEVCPRCGLNLIEPSIMPTSDAAQQNNASAANPTGQNQHPQPSKGFFSANQFAGLAIFTGFVLIVVGIINLVGIKDLRFGADFYSEAYKAIATCARALYGMYIIIGLILILNNGYKICKNNRR